MEKMSQLLSMLSIRAYALFKDKSFSFALGIIVTLCAATMPYFAPFAFVGGILTGCLRGMFDAHSIWGNPYDPHCQNIWFGSIVGQLFLWIFLATWV